MDNSNKKYNIIANNSLVPYYNVSNLKILSFVKNGYEKWVSVKTDVAYQYQGIQWNFDPLIFPELNSSDNGLLMKFKIKSNKNQMLLVGMNYDSQEQQLVYSKYAKRVYLEAGEIQNIEVKIPTTKIDNPKLIYPSIINLDTYGLDFEITDINFSPIYEKNFKYDIPTKMFYRPDGNFGSTISHNSFLGKEWITAQLATNQQWSGFCWVFTVKELAEFLSGTSNETINLRLNLLTTKDCSVYFALNALKEDGTTLISSTALKVVKSNKDEIIRYEFSMPVKFSNPDIKVLNLIIMNPDASDTPMSISITDIETFEKPYLDISSDSGTDSFSSRVPKMKLTGSISGMDKETYKVLAYTFQDHSRSLSGYAKLKWQGDSSLSYPKKNYKFVPVVDKTAAKKKKITPFGGYKSDNEFNLKANYIDASHGRNIVNSELFAQITADRKDLNPKILSSDSFATIKGKPVIVYLNNQCIGLYTFNTTKDLYDMDDTNNNNIVISATSYRDEASFHADTAKIDGTDFEIIQNSGDNSDTITKFSRLMKFVNSSTDAEFTAHVHEYIDVNSVIDYALFTIAIQNDDGVVKNCTYSTWDGNIWGMTAYDLDTSWQLYWDGTKLNSYDEDLLTFGNNKLVNRVLNNNKDEFKRRYFYLRGNILSTSNVINKFKSWYESVGQENYELEAEVWPTIPSMGVTNYQQIVTAIYTRLSFVDTQINNF